MLSRHWVLGLGVLVLAACGQQQSEAPAVASVASVEQAVGSAVASEVVQAQAFVCENKVEVQIVRANENEILLATGGQELVLKADVSGSGERFVNEKGLNGQAIEWHQKGDEAAFAYADEQGKVVETACKAN